MSAGLRARGLARSFGGVHAVRDVSIDVAPGEVVGLIGPNGAGKSTVVHLLHGSLRPDAGRVWVDGGDVTALPPHERSRRGLVRTFQTSLTFPSLTALDAVAAGLTTSADDSFARRLRAPRRSAAAGARVRDRARGLLDDVGLGRVPLDVPVGTLPPAVNRMLGLAIALAVEPRVLLLDEPCAGLAGSERDLLTTTTARLAADGVGVLLIDHDVRVIMRACHRIVVLNEGAVIAAGTPEEVRGDDRVRKAYLGEDDARA